MDRDIEAECATPLHHVRQNQDCIACCVVVVQGNKLDNPWDFADLGLVQPVNLVVEKVWSAYTLGDAQALCSIGSARSFSIAPALSTVSVTCTQVEFQKPDRPLHIHRCASLA